MVQGHPDNKRQNWDLNPGPTGREAPETEKLTAGFIDQQWACLSYGSHEQALKVKHKEAFVHLLKGLF